MACELCTKREKTWIGEDPKCAFVYSDEPSLDTNIFNPENWQCATMTALRELSKSEKPGTFHYRDDFHGQSIGVVHVCCKDNEVYGPGFYIVMTWYKNRGCCAQAFIMDDERMPSKLTLSAAKLALKDFVSGKE
jgi:hypothetical protein